MNRDPRGDSPASSRRAGESTSATRHSTVASTTSDADLLHPPDVQLQVRPLRGQRVQAPFRTPGKVAAQVRSGVLAGGALEAGQVSRHCQPQPISEQHRIGGGRAQRGEVHHEPDAAGAVSGRPRHLHPTRQLRTPKRSATPGRRGRSEGALASRAIPRTRYSGRHRPAG